MYKIRDFWLSLAEFVADFGISIPICEWTILFGNHSEKPTSLSNILVLWAKSFIWSNKFNNFKHSLKHRLIELMELDFFNEYYTELNNWNSFLNFFDLG